jgi:hypothetical protein
MDSQDIIRMAVEVGAVGCANPDKWGILEISYESLERFAALVAAHERERIIAANAPEIEKVNEYIKALEDSIATGIRARGEK